MVRIAPPLVVSPPDVLDPLTDLFALGQTPQAESTPPTVTAPGADTPSAD